ncbi:MAG: hypothetical protein M1114_02995 [Candidatus Dependentiae bacterium]|nr:hypothetical protein [Candidatus Dependentiae bacterium]
MNIIKTTLFSAAILLINVKCQAMSYTKSKLNQADFEKLAIYTRTFLQENLDYLEAQENESGFVRINIPISSALKTEFEEISKLRINYWSPDVNVQIQPESLHTHPQYFESYIVNGGYTHDIYEHGNMEDAAYDSYHIFKQEDARSFEFFGESRLRFLKRESVEKGSIVLFNRDLIHKVVSSVPHALSLNVVFNGSDQKDVGFYDIHLTKNGTLNDIKTTRKLLTDEESKYIVKSIISIL